MAALARHLNTARITEGLVVAVRPLDAAAPLLAVWRDLSRNVLVENLFFEAEFALAAADAFGGGIHLLTVSDRPPEEQGARLLALWPYRVVHRWGVPIPVLMGWTHGFSIFGAPLLATDEAEPALRALLDAPRHLGLPRRLFMPYLPLDGPFALLVDRIGAETDCRRVDFWAHERGFLDLTNAQPSARHQYLTTRLSDRRTRQLARFARRISAGATVEHEIIRDASAIPEALSDYVALEAAGWKGRARTAIGQSPAELGFLRSLAESYSAIGRLRIDRLRRDDHSLATTLSLQTDTTLWFLKISHDEREEKNSPGALLVERVTQSLLDDPEIVTADSCAPPNFPLIETFWGERRRLAHGLIEAGGGDRLFSLAMKLEGLRAMASRVRTDFSSRTGAGSSAKAR